MADYSSNRDWDARDAEERIAASLNFTPSFTLGSYTRVSACKVCAALVLPDDRQGHATWHEDNGESHVYA